MIELIDFHTHILPQMDDGAKNAQMSISMLKAEYAQGVRKVVLTPHFYPYREEAERFLSRREERFAALQTAIAALPEQEKQTLPELILGAEVAWSSSLLETDIQPFRIGKGNAVLLELPTHDWNKKMVSQIYELQMRQGIVPVLAHFERYLPTQDKTLIYQMLEMGVPIQLGTMPFLSFFERGKVLSLIRKGFGHIIASDCHNMDTRKPDLAKAIRIIEKKLGTHVVKNLQDSAYRLMEGQ